MFYHDVVDRDNGVPTKRWGWLTTAQNRAWILDYLDSRMRVRKVQLSSPKLYDEIFNYVTDPRTGRGDHKKGKHDDLLIALAIALWVIRENPWVNPTNSKNNRNKQKSRRPKGGY